MGCARTSFMSKTQSIYCILSILWIIIPSPLVSGTLVMSETKNCSSYEFWYEPIRDCIPLGKRSYQSVPPPGMACPLEGDWYWSSHRSVCLPARPITGVSPLDSVSCPTHHMWHAATNLCIRTGLDQRSTTCGTTEFWFSEKAACLPRRSPGPSSTLCPSGWYWSAPLTSCVPANPEARSSLACGDSHVWSPSTLICQRIASPTRRSPSNFPSRRTLPSPSPGHHSRRHSLKSRTISLCPAGLDACPILKAGDLSDYECVDPKYDLQHCGGCSVDGRGEDCTSIKGVWNVECVEARCSVLICRAGYTPSTDRRSCVRL